MPNGIPVTGVNELVLEVVDLEAAERFYAGTLGLPVVERRTGADARVWLMAGERTRIGLWEPQLGIASGRGGVHVHYALHIEEAHFDATVERLRANDLRPEIVSFEDEGRGRAVYVTDPDGNVVELWTWDVAGHLAGRPP